MPLVSLVASPDHPDARFQVAVVIDPTASVEARALAYLGSSSYESDNAWYVLQSDAWVERRLDGDRLTLDFVAYSRCLDGFEEQTDQFVARSSIDQEAIRLLRIVGQVDPVAYSQAAPETLLVFDTSSFVDALAALADGEGDPLVFAPAPEVQ